MTVLEQFIETFGEACDMDSPDRLFVFKSILLEFATLAINDKDFQEEVLSEAKKVNEILAKMT
jgi:hypothetical protein